MLNLHANCRGGESYLKVGGGPRLIHDSWMDYTINQLSKNMQQYKSYTIWGIDIASCFQKCILNRTLEICTKLPSAEVSCNAVAN